MKKHNKNMMTISQIMIFVGIIMTAVGGLLYYIYSNKEKSAEKETTEKETNKLKHEIIDEVKLSKDTILYYQDSNTGLLKKNIMELTEVVAEVKTQTPTVNVNNSPNTNVQITGNGDNIINQPKVEYKAGIVYFAAETQIDQDDNLNQCVMKFYFGSKDGFPLTNPSVDITFDNPVIGINGGVIGSGMVPAGNLKKQLLEDNRRYIISTNILNSGNYFYIQTISEKELKIINILSSP